MHLVCLHFNSIKVQLEPMLHTETLNQSNNFNSIKVQLERYTPHPERPHSQISIP